MLLVAIAAALLLACSPTEAAIHRHANYTLWPVRMAGRDGPEEELARYQPQRPQPSKPFKPKANTLGATSGDATRSPAVEAAWARLKRCSEPPPGIRDCTTAEWADVWRGFKDAGIDPNQASGEGELDDQDATPSGQPPSTATPPSPSPSTSPWPRRDVTDGAAAALARLDATPHRKLPFDHVPMANSSAAEDGESFSDSVRSLAAVDRRANLSVTKLNLWERFPTTSGDARMQHGHFIRLDNPHRHFSVHEPRGGCKATKEQGGLERTSDNARRNRCRVATNAGFFNVQRPPAGQPFIRHCYNTLISRDGRFVQKQHTRLRSQQFTRNVHFGLTSHGHFFIGYLDDQLLRDHVRPGTVVPEDIDDLQLRRDEAAAREKRAAEVAAAAAARNGGGGGGGSSSSSGSRSGVDAATGAKYTLAPVRSSQPNKTSSTSTRSPSDPEPEDPRWHFSTLIGGVTWLVRDGREYVLDSVLRDREDMRVEMSECSWAERCGDDPSGFRRSEHFLHLNSARTALGHTADGALVILSIDGVTHDAADPSSMRPGDTEKPGVTLYDMARMLVSFGVVNAINLDGGGSATVVVDGVVSNYPSDAAAMPPWEGSTWSGRQSDLIASSEREVSSITCIYDHDEGDNAAGVEGGSGTGTGGGAQRGAGAGADDPAAPTPVREIDVHINNATGSVMVFNASTMLNASRAEVAAAAAAAAAPADGPSALEQSLRNQLFWFNIAVPLLASFTLLLMLAFAYYCWVTRNAGRSAPLTHSGGFERVGGDAGGMGAAVAVSPRVAVADMFADEEGARETGPWSSKGRRSPRLDQEDSDAAALRLELGGAGHADAAVHAIDAADSDIERPHLHPSSVVEALGVERAVALPLAVTAAAAGNGQSARDFAFRDLDARDDLCIHSPPKEQASKDADAALDAQTLRLQREAAAHQRQTHKERRKFTSAKHGGQAPAAESLSGLVAAAAAGDGVYELGELSDDEQDIGELP